MSGSFKTAMGRSAHDRSMSIDLRAASAFMTTHARLLDRQRFRLPLGESEPGGVLAALEAYRNADGGYGWGLEPDLRAPESQPGGALHAFEAFAEVAPATSPRAAELCDWLAAASLPDGGLPFALPVADAAGCAPFWAEADATVSSLHITSAVVAMAHRVAAYDPAVARHPWLAAATRYCLGDIAGLDEPRSALELLYVLGFLDALTGSDGSEPDAAAHLQRMAAAIPPSGELPVEGGAADEKVRPLDLAPWPDRPVRRHLHPEAVAADLDRLAAGQADHGGWEVDYAAWSPAAALEWNGYATVRAVAVLRANGRLR
jgi:hypothetical protein